MSRNSALLLAGFALFAAGCRSTPKWARVDPALATLVPPGTVVMAGIRMDRLRETPAWKQYIAQRRIPLLDDAARETALDLRRDLWEVTLVSNGAQTAALARGRFAEQGIEPRVSPNARRIPYKGYTLLGTERGALVLLNSTTAVAGAPASLMWVIDERGKATGPPKALSDLLATIPWENQVWLVASGGTVNLPGNAANFARMLGMAESAKAALRVDSGAEMSAQLTGRNEAEARNMEDVLRGLSALARLARDPEIQRAAENLQITRTGRTLAVKLALTAPELAKLLD